MINLEDVAKLRNEETLKERFTDFFADPRGVETLAGESSHAEEVSAALAEFLKDFPKTRGWLCFQSRVITLEPGNRLPEEEILLSGELSGDGATSFHLHPRSGGGWRWLRLSEMEDGPYLVEKVRHIGVHQPQPGDLLYRRYWGQVKDWGIRPVLARFQGFRKGEASS